MRPLFSFNFSFILSEEHLSGAKGEEKEEDGFKWEKDGFPPDAPTNAKKWRARLDQWENTE